MAALPTLAPMPTATAMNVAMPAVANSATRKAAADNAPSASERSTLLISWPSTSRSMIAFDSGSANGPAASSCWWTGMKSR